MPKPAKLLDYGIVDTVGTGSFGICKQVRRLSDGKVC